MVERDDVMVCPHCQSGDALYTVETVLVHYPVRFFEDDPQVPDYTGTEAGETFDETAEWDGVKVHCDNLEVEGLVSSVDMDKHTLRLTRAQAAVAKAESARAAAEERRLDAVRAAREAGLTYAQIGDALGMTRQGALAIITRNGPEGSPGMSD